MGQRNIERRWASGKHSVVAFLLFLNVLCPPAAAVTNPTDVTALNVLASVWRGSNLQWSGNDPCGSRWQGVECDSTGTNVTQLILSSMSLTGTIPSSLGLLVNLLKLELSFNKFNGNLPTELGDLVRLTSLSIQSSGLTGHIPDSLQNLKKLTFLALNGNQLTGQIPSSLGSLPLLYWLDLSFNNLTGSLPVSTTSQDRFGLDNMQSAVHFHLNNNFLSGSIPPELGTGSLIRLIHLLLDSNSLTGEIPGELGNLTSLQILSLKNNQLNGMIPSHLNQLNSTGFQQLLVANNQLTGKLPDLTPLTQLQLVDFSNNKFDNQTIPSWFTLPNLQTLIMEQGNLIGPLPANILGLSYLQTLRFRQNYLNGTVNFPSVIGPQLSLISLQQNDIMNINQANSDVNLRSVDFLIGGNPICYSKFYNVARFCNLGADQSETWSSPLNQSNSCPAVSCSGGTTLNPQNCTCAHPLVVLLVLRSPSFSVITDALVSKLQTEIQTGLNLKVGQVWISNATFTEAGRVNVTTLFFPADPSQQSLSQQNQTSIISSLNQQDISLVSDFGPYYLANTAAALTTAASKATLSSAAIVGIVVGCAIVGLLLAGIALYAVIQKRRADRIVKSNPFASWGGGGGDNGAAPVLKGARWFSFAELKKATNNFSDSNEIGAGGYGKVYKGTLSTGDVVAVKRAEEGSMQGAAEFKTEIELLSRVHHRNLVGLVGFCYEQGEQMLVYEFMSNGTLREHLLGQMEQALDWPRRLNIAVGSARGLAYLHELANPPIIHRDVKSSNILLDETMIAKVSDFGLSKVAPNGGDKLYVSTQVKGTVGYLDPEYYMTQQLSGKSDVYSFGVVLLELITARQPIERGKYIVREVRTALDKGGISGLRSLLDPFLGDYPVQDLEGLLDVALACVEESSINRPTMTEVVQELEAILRNSAPVSGAGGTDSPKRPQNVYADPDMLEKGQDSSFQYSGGYTLPTTIEPK